MKWQAIEGFEGIYEVSDIGEVRTVEGKITHSERHGIRKWSSRILKQKTDRDGYKRLTLYKDKIPKTLLVHRLVAIAFCDKEEGKNLVNHKDGNPSNNHFTNLEWCTYKENNNHAFENDLMKTNKKVILIDKETKEEFEFYSMTKASYFIGHKHSYISDLLKRGKTENRKYLIKLKE